jgi:hypothetical protein
MPTGDYHRTLRHIGAGLLFPYSQGRQGIYGKQELNMDDAEITIENMEKAHLESAGKAYIKKFVNDYIASEGVARINFLNGMLGLLRLPKGDIVKAIESYRDDITSSLNDLIATAEAKLGEQ